MPELPDITVYIEAARLSPLKWTSRLTDEEIE